MSFPPPRSVRFRLSFDGPPVGGSPTHPENMPVNNNLDTLVGSPQFDEDQGQVEIFWSEAILSGDGYWIYGIGEAEHSQWVQDNAVTSVVLAHNDGAGDPYTPEEIDGEWFCVRVVHDGEVSGQLCNTFQVTVPTEAPAVPTNVSFTTPGAFTHRTNADIQGAAGAEIEISSSGSGGPWTIENDVTQGELPWDRTSDPETQLWMRMRGYNIDDVGTRLYSNYTTVLDATTPESAPAGEAFPHQPSNHALISESEMRHVGDPGEWINSGTGILGGYKQIQTGWSTPTVVSRPSAPHSVDAVRIRYPTNMVPGQGPGTINMTSGPTILHANLREMYVSYRVRWVGAGDGTFELPQVWKPLGFFGSAGYHASLYLIAWPGGWQNTTEGRKVSSIGTPGLVLQEPSGPDGVPRFLDQVGQSALWTSGGPSMSVGVDRHVEVLLRTNDIGSTNGIYRQWHNGLLVADYSGLQFRNSAHPGGLHGVHLNPTYGGGGDFTKSRNDDTEIYHVRVTGIPL